MPIKSPNQYGLMQKIAHDGAIKNHGAGPSPAVAREFIEKTPAKKRSKFAKAINKR